MGYRSDVAYTIQFRNLKVMNEYIALVMAMGGTKLQALKECLVNKKAGELMIGFHTQDVKWYDSFPDVQAHTWLYKFAAERFPNDTAYKFVRIGEDDNDNEVDEYCPAENPGSYRWIDDLYIHKTINVSFYDYDPVGDDLCVDDPENVDSSVK